jgi:hypothetical protein
MDGCPTLTPGTTGSSLIFRATVGGSATRRNAGAYRRSRTSVGTATPSITIDSGTADVPSASSDSGSATFLSTVNWTEISGVSRPSVILYPMPIEVMFGSAR